MKTPYSLVFTLFPLISLTTNLYALDVNFPYGQPPAKGSEICASSSTNFSTPETLMGSWAMRAATCYDEQKGNLPNFMNKKNTAYAVGTAAVGDLLGLSNCKTGCDELNGYCFAMRINDKVKNQDAFQYVIFQTVNIGAAPNTFDLYIAGGGCGAFCQSCANFWGGNIDWSQHILDKPFEGNCDAYFNQYKNFTPQYQASYNGKAYGALETLKNACKFTQDSQFNHANFKDVSVIPVTCPQSLVQISGIGATPNPLKVGKLNIIELNKIAKTDFDTDTAFQIHQGTSNYQGFATTQMQDCQIPSSGYCNKPSTNLSPNYTVSISANLSGPIVSAPPPSYEFCQNNPGLTGYCSWDNGKTNAGGEYCNADQGQCTKDCNGSWCSCDRTSKISTCVKN
jgi:hypothetical protein